MRRSARYYAVYAELRHSLGPEVPAKDVARLAEHVIRANDEPGRLGASIAHSKDRSYERQPVDRILSFPSWDTFYAEQRRRHCPGDSPLSLEAGQRLRAIERGKR